MKRVILATVAVLFAVQGFAQYRYEFTDVRRNPATAVKDQAQTGTCWCFATVSFLESEAVKKGTADTSLNLSEMYLVRSTYLYRLKDNYYRAGRGNTGPGAVSHTATMAMERVGLMPEDAYHGINYDSKHHNHIALQAELDSVINVAVKNRAGVPYRQLDSVLDKYLGEVPSDFVYEGKSCTPFELKDRLGLKADDYVEITSFTHHPFYEQVVLEVPDNFEHLLYYNVPIDELVEIIDNAIDKGYTVAWDADMSEIYFAQVNGIALFTPGVNLKTQVEFPSRLVEAPVNQEIRQKMLEDFTTTDDHLMHLIGTAKDQEGAKYYIVKNSWGTSSGPYGGYIYVSEAYVKAKTIAIMINKAALSKGERKKLNIR